LPILETQVNRELLLNFFLTFARFEYALKACGFYQRRNLNSLETPRIYDAKPDWDRFAVSLRSSFQVDRNDQLRQACEYIINSPPNKQIIVNNSVAWETPARPSRESDIEFILRMVRCIRNNLFHGGKHSAEVHEDIERTGQLLNSSLVILKECQILAPDLERIFEEATI
jgi:hypothetical protein